VEPKILAIIPARGGSRGIPKKNIRLLGGKPLISYTIEEALKSKHITKVIVSTDSAEIAKVAEEYGAEVPFIQSKETSAYDSSGLSCILEVLKKLKEKENYIPDIVVYLQPTSPFRNSKHMDDAISLMLDDEEVEGVFGVKRVENHPYMMFKQNETKSVAPFLEMENRPLRRQEFPELYVTNASLYVTRGKYYNTARDPEPYSPIFGEKAKAIVMDSFSSMDIDEEKDLELCEVMLKTKNDQNRR
jgi:CMP-N,N'-diacetyllegionaminic acid synthase